MTRPEHVRCENCCYAWKNQEDNLLCRKLPPGMVQNWHLHVDADEFCGEFRSEWPAPIHPSCTTPPVENSCKKCGRALQKHDVCRDCLEAECHEDLCGSDSGGPM